MKLPVDLGMEWEHGPMVHASMDAKEHYPDFTYEGDSPLGLPDAGVMKIRFRKARSSERLETDGDKCYSCTVEVLAIESVKSEKVDAEEDMPSKKVGDTEDALDKLMSEKMAEKDSEDY